MARIQRSNSVGRAVWIAWSAACVCLLGCARGVMPIHQRPPEPSIVLPMFDASAAAQTSASTVAEGPLAVRDVRPEGPGNGEGIRLRLDRAVVDPDNPPEDVTLVLERIAADGRRHPVASTSVWTRADTLELRPEAPLPDATEFAVRLEGRIVDRDGAIVEGVAWRFETARPTLWLHDTWEPIDGDAALWVTPSTPIAPSGLAAHLHVSAGTRAVPVRVRAATVVDVEDEDLEPHSLAIEPRGRWPAGAKLAITVDNRLTGKNGPLPLAASWHATAETRPAFTLGAVRCEGGTNARCPLGSVTIATSVAVDRDTARHIRVEPPIDNLLVDIVYDDDDSVGVMIDGEWKAEQRYRIVFSRAVRDEDGRRLQGNRHVDVAITDTIGAYEADLALSSTRGVFTSPKDARIAVHSNRVTDLRVRIAVLPADEATAWISGKDPVGLPWPAVDRSLDTHYTFAESARGTKHTLLDLGKDAALGDVVLVEATADSLATHATEPRQTMVRGVFRISGLGVVVHRGPRSGFVRVTALDTGEPVSGAEVRVIAAGGDETRHLTDPHGLARTGGAGTERQPPLVLVQHGTDAIAIVAKPQPTFVDADLRSGHMTQTGRLAMRPRVRDESAAAPGLRRGEVPSVAVFTGRALYEPGDTIHVAGWAAISTPHETLSSRRLPTSTPVRIELRRGNDAVAKKTVRVDRFGRFTATLRISDASPLDTHRVTATVLGREADSYIIIAQPRLPTFELHASTREPEVLRGTSIEISASARYLTGEDATLTGARATLSCQPTSNWRMTEMPAGYSTHSDAAPLPRRAELEAAPRGASATFAFPTADFDHRRPWSCAAAIAAADLGLQEVGTDTHVLVHPATAYLAMSHRKVFAGRRHAVEMIAVDHSGRRVALHGIDITVERVAKSRRTRVTSCHVDVEATGSAARCTTPLLRAGSYRIVGVAKVGDAPIEIERVLEVDPYRERATVPKRKSGIAAAPPVMPPRALPETPFEVKLAEQLRPGKPATVDITGPWSRASGVLAVEQIGLRAAIPFTLERGHARVRVTPAADLGPTLELVARVARPGTDGDKPVELTAETWGDIAQKTELGVTIDAPEKARIGETAKIRIMVADRDGDAVDARVAVWVVDDAVHLLRAAHPPSFEEIFNPARQRERGVARSYDELLDPYHWFTGRSRRAPSIRQASAVYKGALDVEIRQRFDAAPLFVGNVGTGTDGEVTIALPLPDDLTRFRITAIASASVPGHPESGPARFGIENAEIKTWTPLLVRAAMPRVLRPDDDATVTALVSMPRDGEVEVTLELPDDAVRSRGETRKRVHGRAGTTVSVPFRVHAHGTGKPRLRLRGRLLASNEERAQSGAVEQTVPIEAERTQSDAVALHGSLDDDAVLGMPIRLPARALKSTGTVDIMTSSSLLGGLEDAADYLEQYPYGCVEQSASRMVPLLALHGLAERNADAKAAAMSTPELIAYILTMQLPDGTFAYWPGSTASAGFAGGYALWILQLAAERGLHVPERALARARKAMAALIRDPIPEDDEPPTMVGIPRASPQTAEDWLTHVMILHALAVGGDAEPSDFDLAYRSRGTLTASARLLLAIGLHRTAPKDERLPELVRSIGAMIEERPGVAHIVAPTASETAEWDSGARDDALGLIAMMQLAPDDARIEKLAAGLASRRVGGRWRTTQENAFALLALADYAARHESVVPAHRVRAWIGDKSVLDAKVTGFDAVRRGGAAPLEMLRASATDATTRVTLQREGRGRVHWRVGVRWTEADPQPRSQGLALATRILDEHGAVVTRLVAGRRYRMEVAVTSATPQQHIAVELPLPAGVDAIERTLGHGIAARVASTVESSALSHLELRPDRALLFFDALEPGTTVQQIAVLATAAGTYALPGAVAEAMYEPETRARAKAKRIVIAER